MKFIAASLLFLAALIRTVPAGAAPAEVVIIRHAEKPDIGNELSPRGWQRANALVGLFISEPALLVYGTPAAIYAMAPKNDTASIRPIQTVSPLAQKLGLPVQRPYLRAETDKLAAEIMSTRAYEGKMVLVCWAHKAIPPMLRSFGWSSAPDSWQGDVFDRVWILDFKEGKPVSFRDMPQKLLPGDDLD